MPRPQCGLLLLSVDGIPDACSCLYILVMADSISGSGWQFPAGCCGGTCWGSTMAVPRLLVAL